QEQAQATQQQHRAAEQQQQQPDEQQSQRPNSALLPPPLGLPKSESRSGNGTIRGPQCPFTASRMSRPPSATVAASTTADATDIAVAKEVISPALLEMPP
ncbi:hypothetical protein Vretifemale_18559, partial [Volvox reticuliferus]